MQLLAMASSTQLTSTAGSQNGTSLTIGAKKHLEKVAEYDTRPLRSAPKTDPNAPRSGIDDMIRELAERLDARIASDGPVLVSELKLGPHKFTIFKNLPAELQDRIWVFAALSQPRRVEIEYNAVTDRWGRVKLYERNPPISLRQVCRHLRNMNLKILGYTTLSIKSLFHDKNCTYLFHPGLDMLSMSRLYRDDMPNPEIRENTQNAKAVIDALKKEKILDAVRYFAVNELILCRIYENDLPPTTFELADGVLFTPRPEIDLHTRGFIISQFPNLELLLSINTRCRHLTHASGILDNPAAEFERCLPDVRERQGTDHHCPALFFRKHNYIVEQAVRDVGSSPAVVMVHDLRRNSPTGGHIWSSGDS